MDYTQTGYDEFLTRLPVNSNLQLNPIQNSIFSDEVDGEKITTTLRGDLVGQGINADNITVGEMSFNRAKGGELALGGENDQNGVFSLKNAGGKEIIRLNNEGMYINDGKIDITDKDGKAIIDSSGLISTTNFTSNIINLPANTTYGADGVIPNFSLNFTLKRAQKVFLGLSAWGGNNTITTEICAGTLRFVLDGIGIGSDIMLSTLYHSLADGGVIGGITPSSNSMTYITTIQKGAHTLSVSLDTIGGGQAYITSNGHICSLYYILLGS